MSNKYEQVESGIYKYVDSEGDVTYHERPHIFSAEKAKQVRTYRSLGLNFTKQTNLKNARTELARRRTEIAAGRNPYAQEASQPPAPTGPSHIPAKTLQPPTSVTAQHPGKPILAKNMGEVILRYEADEYPDKHKQKRTGETLDSETTHCNTLMEFWEDVPVDDAGPGACDQYHTWRTEIKKVRKGCTGNRQVDRELNTLNNACRWGVRCGILKSNPMSDRPRFQPAKEVHHCREFCPKTTDELYDTARLFFQHPNSVVLGFQLLAESLTGLRTGEILMWGEEEFGKTTECGEYVNVWRFKGQHHNNPYCGNHDGLKALFKAHAAWKAANFPDCPEFLPSHCGGTVSKGALARALRRLHKDGKLKRKLKPHGAGRAFYVLVRRSQGAKDEVIADEIGHSSNGACIKTTYGGVPENWRNGKGPNMKWLPTKVPVAWAELEANEWKFPTVDLKQEPVKMAEAA